ncbi:MAG: hypothetical protein R6V20_02125 [Desulfobia sp.]
MDNPVISLYLNLTPPRNVSAELNSMLHKVRMEIAEQFGKKQRKALDRVLESIEQHFRENYDRPSGCRLVALFADADGLWQEHTLPVAMPSQIVVEPDTYTRPLIMLLEEFSHYCVLVCDSRKARIFSLYLEDFEEEPDIYLEDNVPDRVRVNRSRTIAGGNVQGGLGDENIRHHIEDHIQHHLKNTAARVFRMFRQKNFHRLILGGPENKIRQQFKNHLHSYLRRRLVGEFKVSPNDRDEVLRQKALETVHAWEREQEKALIAELFEKNWANGLGVLGIEPVLDALKMGQVHTLVIEKDFRQNGTLCHQDRILSTYLATCPLCGRTMEKTENLANYMVKEALAQDAEIRHIFTEHEDFGHYKVGALLRFTLA